MVNKMYGEMHLVTEFFHSLPHLNMWFLQSNSTFDPNNSDYLEVNNKITNNVFISIQINNNNNLL
jgi:hypothetical protein